MKKWTQLTKKQKWVIAAISAGLLCGGTFGGYQAYAAHQQTSERLALEEKLSVLDKHGELATAIDGLEDSDGYLSESISNGEIDQLQEQLRELTNEIKAYKKKAPQRLTKDLTAIDIQQENLEVMQKNLARIQKKFTLQGKVNGLFHGTDLAIDGSEVSKDVIIADGTTSKTIEDLDLSDPAFEEDKWLESITDLVNEANEQLDVIAKADKAINACYKDKKVDPKVTKRNYEAAEKAVKVVKREVDKERLNKKLTEVKKVVDANEKKDKEKAEKEKQEKAAQAAAQETAQNETSSESSSQNQTSAESAGNSQSTSNGSTANNWSNGNTSSGGSGNSSNTSSGNGSGGSTTNGGSNSNNSSGNNSSTGGGNSTGSNNTNNGGGNTTPDKPYAINPYTGSGTYYSSYEAANAAGRENLNARYYDIVTEYWSDGSEKYYLEFH